MEMLVMIIPLMNLPKVKDYIQSWIHKNQELKVDPDKCAYCESHLTLASKANCDHHFCYYCLASNLTSNPNYTCPICKKVLSHECIQPIRSDSVVSQYLM